MIRHKRRLMHAVDASVMRFVQHRRRPPTTRRPHPFHRRPHAAIVIMPRPVQRRVELRVANHRRRETRPVPLDRHLHVVQRRGKHHPRDPARHQDFLQPRRAHPAVVQPELLQRATEFLRPPLRPGEGRFAKPIPPRLRPRRAHPHKRQPLPVRRALGSANPRHQRSDAQIGLIADPRRHRLHVLRRRRFHERASAHRQRRRGQRHAGLPRHLHQRTRLYLRHKIERFRIHVDWPEKPSP